MDREGTRQAIIKHAEEWAQRRAMHVRSRANPLLTPEEHEEVARKLGVKIDTSHVQTDNKMRDFGTGAVRSSDAGRYDPEGFLSPIALERFCEYMNKHRVQADGGLRDSDNWQKGMPLATYMKGMWRHFLHLWQRHRGWTVTDAKAAADAEEDLCALMFNVQGMLHEMLRARRAYEGLDSPSERK